MLLCIVVPRGSLADESAYWQPFVYSEDFSEGELNAWASYPPNQDTAYDPYLYPGTIRPDDMDTCLVARCEAPWNETQRFGAVKRLRCLLDTNSNIRFRYYLKSVSAAPEMSVYIALESGERIVWELPAVKSNAWCDVSLGWSELADSFPALENRRQIEMSALVIQVKIPDADTDIPDYLGIDDITVEGLRKPAFVFSEPETALLPEFPEAVVLRHFTSGETLRIEGDFQFMPKRARLVIAPFRQRGKELISVPMMEKNGRFSADVSLDQASFPKGMYYGCIRAEYDRQSAVETAFVFLVNAPGKNAAHPRLIADSGTIGRIRKRFASPRFANVRETILREAERLRTELDPSTLMYDTNQFPEDDWLPSLSAWSGQRIRISREALFFNALVFGLEGSREAGQYCREVLLRLAAWPRWNHPWMEKRGFHTYYPLGEFALDYSLAFDLCYDLLDDKERGIVQNALYDNFIEPAYRTYVVDDQVTSNSSNWISHIVGGALFSLAAIDRTDGGNRPVEPLLSGFLMKMGNYIDTAFDRDGAYGEGFRYFNFAMQSFAWTLPVIEHRYGVDFSGPLKKAHIETLWASNLDQNYAFTFGDSEPFLKREASAKWIAAQNGPMNSWAWLVSRGDDPVLAWLYRELKEYDTIHEVFNETGEAVVKTPDSLGDVRIFHDVGTAVFKSGWGGDDFCFVFRCGPFYNHQHLDQGTFFLADYGEIFIEERHDGEHHYYDDPVYRSHAIQPIGHNTILIDGNPQSQKTGDPNGFAPGMDDQAHFTQWLNADHFAFVEGDLAPVYPDGPEYLRRSVLYVKPRSVVLIDEAGSDNTCDLDLLFHTRWKDDIEIENGRARFMKDSCVLHFIPLTADDSALSVRSEPHFLHQFDQRPLRERGYLDLHAQCGGGERLMTAQIMAASADRTTSGITVESGDGQKRVVCPSALGESILSLRTGNSENRLGQWRSDAAILASHEGENAIFAVNATELSGDDGFQLRCNTPLSLACAVSGAAYEIVYYAQAAARLELHTGQRPRAIVDGNHETVTFSYDRGSGITVVELEKGGGELAVTVK